MRTLTGALLVVALVAVAGCGKRAQYRAAQTTRAPVAQAAPAQHTQQPATSAQPTSGSAPRLTKDQFVKLLLELGNAARGVTSPSQAPEVTERALKTLEKYGLTAEQFREEAQYWMGDRQRSQEVFKAMAAAAQAQSR